LPRQSPNANLPSPKFRRLKLVLFILALLSLTCAFAVYNWLFVDLPSLDSLYARAAAPSTKLLDRNGQLLYEIIDPHRGKHTPVALDAIPLQCQQATIATEDANFYNNPGVDLGGILRALWINLQGGETLAGGSTITQQLARNLLLSPEERSQRTLTRKLRESILAWRMAERFGKDEILALYLNEVYYGNLAYGIEAAAQAYFGAPVGQLDLAQCALLAGLPQSPVTYDPLVDLQAAKDRQAIVLDLMRKANFIDGEQAALAKAENLKFAPTPFPIEAPHFVAYVTTWLEDRFGLEAIYTQGLIVTTTLDLNWQHSAEAIAQRQLKRLQEGTTPNAQVNSPGKNANNAALVALDPNSGEILTMLGSPDYFNAQIDGAVNAAIALRQPGSAIKPLTYATAFDPATPNPLTPASMILDVRTSFPTREGDPYVPRNYDLQFHGPVSAREALASSYNIPAVKVLQHVGLERMIAQARSLGIGTFGDSSRYGFALTLGGGEVRLIDMVTAYGAFANGGRRVLPAAVLKVSAASGEVLYNVQPQLGEQILDTRVAYLISDILSDNTARAPAFGEFSVLRLTRPASVKTGTTTDWRDNWTIGYTPDLVVGVWVGNADNQPMERVSGVDGAGPIWHDFMQDVLRGTPERNFDRPGGLVDVNVCATSGMLPTPYCPFTKREIFIAGTEPKQPDSLYRPVDIDVATGLPATSDTPLDRIETRIYLTLPAEAQEWARDHGIPQLPTSNLHAPISNVQLPTSDFQIHITRPDDGALYRITPQTPIDSQRIPVQAIAADGVRIAQLTLFVDGQPIESVDRAPLRTLWTLALGQHVFTVEGIDHLGNRLSSAPVTIVVTQ
jgi:penicillin-binding protein 1C